jgi:hypothetical protein
MGRDTEKG